MAVARTKRDEAKALLLDNLDPMEEKQKAKIAAQRASLLFETVALEWHVEMSRRWTESHAKTVLSRLRTHVFPLIGQRPIAELDTRDLLEVTQRIKDRGTMDVALRVQNYLSTIMRGAKRARQITQSRRGLDPLIKLSILGGMTWGEDWRSNPWHWWVDAMAAISVTADN